MREIKFRGKDKLYRSWRYGDLRNYENGQVGISNVSAVHGYGTLTSEVDPATVGQYMGLKDITGQEIYEGDIIQHGNTRSVAQWYGEVGEWGFVNEEGVWQSWFWSVGKGEPRVIGNIHDKELTTDV